MASVTFNAAYETAREKLAARGVSPAIIGAILQALANVFADFCVTPTPSAGDLAAFAKRGLSDCQAGHMTPERHRLRFALFRQGIQIRRGQLDDAELATWQTGAETPPREIEKYAAVWAAEPQ